MLICCCFVYLAAPTADESRRTLKTLFLCGMGLAVFVVFFSIFEELFFDTLFHILSPTAQEYLLFFVPGGYAITLGGCTYTCYLMFFGMAACCGYVCSEAWGKKSILMLLACGFLLFALLRNCGRGSLGFESLILYALPDWLYRNHLTAYLGFPHAGFFSTDYFPLLPWVFLFITGFYLFQITSEKGFNEKLFARGQVPLLNLIGRNSLLVYLLHQPVLYGLGMLIFYVLK
jgi:hypothetical protein